MKNALHGNRSHDLYIGNLGFYRLPTVLVISVFPFTSDGISIFPVLYTPYCGGK